VGAAEDEFCELRHVGRLATIGEASAIYLETYNSQKNGREGRAMRSARNVITVVLAATLCLLVSAGTLSAASTPLTATLTCFADGQFEVRATTADESHQLYFYGDRGLISGLPYPYGNFVDYVAVYVDGTILGYVPQESGYFKLPHLTEGRIKAIFASNGYDIDVNADCLSE
jgi:hypothetical protein